MRQAGWYRGNLRQETSSSWHGRVTSTSDQQTRTQETTSMTYPRVTTNDDADAPLTGGVPSSPRFPEIE